jgi:hypothetical protein
MALTRCCRSTRRSGPTSRRASRRSCRHSSARCQDSHTAWKEKTRQEGFSLTMRVFVQSVSNFGLNSMFILGCTFDLIIIQSEDSMMTF